MQWEEVQTKDRDGKIIRHTKDYISYGKKYARVDFLLKILHLYQTSKPRALKHQEELKKEYPDFGVLLRT